MSAQSAFARRPSAPVITTADLLDDMADDAASALGLMGLRPASPPADYGLQSEFGADPLTIEPRPFFGDDDSPIHYGRVARVRGGHRVQVLNVVLFPTLQSGWPILGIEILAFTKGVHLVVFDAFNTAGNPRHPHFSDLLRRRRDGLVEHFGPTPVPDWGASVFSDDAILIKPDPRQDATIAQFAPAFHDVLDAYLGDGLGAPLDSAAQTRAQQSRRNYLYSHGHHEPAGPFLERISDAQWVEQFVFDFLYPTWLYDGDDLPQWA